MGEVKRRRSKRMSRNTRIGRRGKAGKPEKPSKLTPSAARISGVVCIVFLVWFTIAKIGGVSALSDIPINEVRFEGIGTLDEAELLKKANIDRDTNLLCVNLKHVAERLLESEPLIKDAEVRRNFYSGELTIKLKLREPVALLNCGGIYGIDADGVLLWKVEGISYCDLPLINGVDIKDAKPRQKIKLTKLDVALEILDHVSSSNLESVVILSEINVKELRNVCLYVGEGATEIRLGRDRFRENIHKAAAILKDLQNAEEEAEYIDFRVRFGGRTPLKIKKRRK